MRIFLLLMTIIISACTSKVQIRSTPEGASVTELLKGDLGTTPTQVTFDSGWFGRGLFGTGDCPENKGDCQASLSFSLEGYEPEKIVKMVDGDHIIVHANLQPVVTSLQISVFPDFATVEAFYQKVNGEWSPLSLTGKVGNTLSLNEIAVWEGRDNFTVRLNIESSGYIPVEKHLTVYKGEQQLHEYVLDEFAIFGTIESSPAGADVYEKSLGYLGRTPFNIRIPYDQLVRISPQRILKLNEPVYLFLEFKKTGYQPTSKIKSVGEIDESEKGHKSFHTLVKLPLIQEKH